MPVSVAASWHAHRHGTRTGPGVSARVCSRLGRCRWSAARNGTDRLRLFSARAAAAAHQRAATISFSVPPFPSRALSEQLRAAHRRAASRAEGAAYPAVDLPPPPLSPCAVRCPAELEGCDSRSGSPTRCSRADAYANPCASSSTTDGGAAMCRQSARTARAGGESDSVAQEKEAEEREAGARRARQQRPTQAVALPCVPCGSALIASCTRRSSDIEPCFPCTLVRTLTLHDQRSGPGGRH